MCRGLPLGYAPEDGDWFNALPADLKAAIKVGGGGEVWVREGRCGGPHGSHTGGVRVEGCGCRGPGEGDLKAAIKVGCGRGAVGVERCEGELVCGGGAWCVGGEAGGWGPGGGDLEAAIKVSWGRGGLGVEKCGRRQVWGWRGVGG